MIVTEKMILAAKAALVADYAKHRFLTDRGVQRALEAAIAEWERIENGKGKSRSPEARPSQEGYAPKPAGARRDLGEN